MTDHTSLLDRPLQGRKLAWIVVLAATIIALDLVVKRLVTDALGPEADSHEWWLAGNVVGLEYTRNSGAAFGIFQGNAELLAALSIVISLGLTWLMLVEISRPLWSVLAAGLLLGGSIANQISRLGDGYVTDYFAVGPWPRFNVADSAITTGVAIFFVALLFQPSESSTPQASADATSTVQPSQEGNIQRDRHA